MLLQWLNFENGNLSSRHSFYQLITISTSSLCLSTGHYFYLITLSINWSLFLPRHSVYQLVTISTSSLCLSTGYYLYLVNLSINWSINYYLYLIVYLSIYGSLFLPNRQSVYLRVAISTYSSICLSTDRYLYLIVNLSIYGSLFLPNRLSVYLRVAIST